MGHDPRPRSRFRIAGRPEDVGPLPQVGLAGVLHELPGSPVERLLGDQLDPRSSGRFGIGPRKVRHSPRSASRRVFQASSDAIGVPAAS